MGALRGRCTVLRRASVMLTAAALVPAAVPAAGPAPFSATATLDAGEPGPKVDRHIFGQFVEHLGRGVYDGIWVGQGSSIPNVRGIRSDVVAALRELRVPMIRWPGGCFAEYYRWRDGIGPRGKRPVRVNFKWGGVEESNAFGTHEYFDLAGQLGADAYVAGNIGSATPAELSDWVEYITSPTRSTLAQERRANGRKQPWRLPFVGIGNEVSNCGGSMRPDYAADVYRRFQTFLFAPPSMQRIATGPYEDEYDWTETMMRRAGDKMDALSFHYYTMPGGFRNKIPALSTDPDKWALTLSEAVRMDPLIARHKAIMDRYDPAKRVTLAVDEWGPWYRDEPGEPPFTFQNTIRDALVAALTINILVRHADRVRIAAIAQMVNVGSPMAFTRGPRMVLTPTYHVFRLYRPFQDAIAIPLAIKSPAYRQGKVTITAVQGSAVRDPGGRLHVALVNVDPVRGAEMSVAIAGFAAGRVTGETVAADRLDAHNDFDRPDAVKPVPFTGARLSGGRLIASLLPGSVTMLQLEAAK